MKSMKTLAKYAAFTFGVSLVVAPVVTANEVEKTEVQQEEVVTKDIATAVEQTEESATKAPTEQVEEQAEVAK